jgi:coproporphyrinogen III oxidase
MNYKIQTPSARRLKEEILKSVESKADANGNGIVNWQCVETDGGDKALVLTEGQWAEKGCITLTQVSGSNELQVRFFYWETCEDRDNGDDKYMLGRFTELLLSHFHYFIDRVIIE